MSLWSYIPFVGGDSDEDQYRFDELREFIYLDELSVRSLLASLGEGGIPIETTSGSTNKTVKGANTKISAPAGPISGTLGGSYRSEDQDTSEVVSSLEGAQSKFTQLYRDENFEKALSIKKVKQNRGQQELPTHSLEEFDRGRIIEVRVELQANLLFRLYQVIEYVRDVAPEEIDPDAEQNLALIRESIGNSVPVVGIMTDYEWTDSEKGSFQTLPSDQKPNENSVVKIVSELELDNLRGDPIRTLSNEDEFIMLCRIEAVDVDTWYPLKLTQVIDTFPGNAADEFNKQMESALREAREEMSSMDIDFNENDTSENYLNFIERYSILIEDRTGISIDDATRKRLLAQAISEVDIEQYQFEREVQKALLEKYTDLFEREHLEYSIDPDTRIALRNNVLYAEIEESQSTDEASAEQESNRQLDGVAFKVKPVAVYW